MAQAEGIMDRESIEERVGQIVGSYPQVEAAYIYGSFLKGEDYRDIDVALLFSQGLSPYQCLKLSLRIGSDLDLQIMPGRDFDVRVLNNAHPEFQYEVIKTGKAVFSRSKEERCDYEAEVISTYLDLKEMYDYYDRRYLAR
ncbi:MAG TPA: nucleotidyltransferase domain-containing protein [Methanothrix sp.]|nr:nucleotidyltransferase domain-containing protein [Methanothrix sp.]HPT18861.1 nucleotidyltransferase domain-containing protein [Methanothrix sp.]